MGVDVGVWMSTAHCADVWVGGWALVRMLSSCILCAFVILGAAVPPTLPGCLKACQSASPLNAMHLSSCSFFLLRIIAMAPQGLLGQLMFRSAQHHTKNVEGAGAPPPASLPTMSRSLWSKSEIEEDHAAAISTIAKLVEENTRLVGKVRARGWWGR